MSVIAKAINLGLKLSGIKKKYSLPEEEFLWEIRKMNRSRGFYMPKDRKAVYREHRVLGYQVLVAQKDEAPAPRGILYFFGGGMMIGPDKGDVDVIAQLVRGTGCDVWFPIYPLCTDHCITEAFEMAQECYRQMLQIYGTGNVSTCGFSSGGALALGVAAHNNAMGRRLPQPRHIVAVSPGEVPWNDEERAIMQRNNAKDMMVDYAFMEKVVKFEKHGNEDVPEYMIHISKGDLSGTPDIHFYWSEDEVLYGAKRNFIDACERGGVPYTITTRPGMIHCYPMLPYYREAKEDFAKIVDILKK